MTFAIEETHSRRILQETHNKIKNITPTTIHKEITDILGLAEKNRTVNKANIGKAKLDLTNASKMDLINLSKNIENEMNVAADLLEFELAARLRDELKELRKEISEFVE